MKTSKTSILLFPFVALLKLIEIIIKITGRLLAVILGLVFMIIGGLLCLTIVGAIIGVPIVIFGFIMVVRGLF